MSPRFDGFQEKGYYQRSSIILLSNKASAPVTDLRTRKGLSDGWRRGNSMRIGELIDE